MHSDDQQGGRCWLIQWLAEEAETSALFEHATLWPAIGQHLADIAVGDRVVLWRAGAGDAAGVWGLGRVSSAVYDREHEVDYGHPGDGTRLRPTVDVSVTHHLEWADIDRPTLRSDPRFSDFVMFKQGGAQGTNPWPLTEAQWQAVLERAPAWSRSDAPMHPYEVTVTLPTQAPLVAAAVQDLQDAFASKRYAELSWQAVRVSGGHESHERLDDPADNARSAARSASVVWLTQVDARTARSAFLQVFLALRGDPTLVRSTGQLSLNN